MVVMGMFVRLILHFMTKHCNEECHGIVQAQGLAELAFDLLYVEMLLTTVVLTNTGINYCANVLVQSKLFLKAPCSQ